MNLEEVRKPTVIEVGEGRVIVFSLGSTTSGIPPNWEAGKNMPGVNLLKDFSDETCSSISEEVRKTKQAGDIAIASINWGYLITTEQIQFAHRLITSAG